MNTAKLLRPVPLLAALAVTALAWILFQWIERPAGPDGPARPKAPAQEAAGRAADGDRFVFAPDNCGFRVRMTGKPTLESEPRGELMTHSATSRTDGGSAVRATCGPWFVQDREAFLAELPAQMDQAARLAGLDVFEVDVRTEGNLTVAEYEGTRESGGRSSFVRSETRVRGNHFLEILYVVDPADADESALRRLAQVEEPGN